MSNVKNKISVLILTLNEDKNIETALKSLTWCDDIVILDSYSNDNTKSVCSNFDVRFYERKFDNYANQRNFGLREIEYKHDWIFMLDADEEVPIQLMMEMQDNINIADSSVTMFRLKRKDFFYGKWIKNSSKYPIWFGRLMKIGSNHIEREINEEFHTTGKIQYLKNHIHHYPFNKGLTWWFDKHNRYSEMEAKKMLEEIKEPIVLVDFFSKDPVLRRKVQKRLSYQLPFRPFLIFVAFYVLKGGFLNGKAGYTFCKLRLIYEGMIDVKLKEIKAQFKN